MVVDVLADNIPDPVTWPHSILLHGSLHGTCECVQVSYVSVICMYHSSEVDMEETRERKSIYSKTLCLVYIHQHIAWQASSLSNGPAFKLHCTHHYAQVLAIYICCGLTHTSTSPSCTQHLH